MQKELKFLTLRKSMNKNTELTAMANHFGAEARWNHSLTAFLTSYFGLQSTEFHWAGLTAKVILLLTAAQDTEFGREMVPESLQNWQAILHFSFHAP